MTLPSLCLTSLQSSVKTIISVKQHLLSSTEPNTPSNPTYQSIHEMYNLYQELISFFNPTNMSNSNNLENGPRLAESKFLESQCCFPLETSSASLIKMVQQQGNGFKQLTTQQKPQHIAISSPDKSDNVPKQQQPLRTKNMNSDQAEKDLEIELLKRTQIISNNQFLISSLRFQNNALIQKQKQTSKRALIRQTQNRILAKQIDKLEQQLKVTKEREHNNKRMIQFQLRQIKRLEDLTQKPQHSIDQRIHKQNKDILRENYQLQKDIHSLELQIASMEESQVANQIFMKRQKNFYKSASEKHFLSVTDTQQENMRDEMIYRPHNKSFNMSKKGTGEEIKSRQVEGILKRVVPRRVVQRSERNLSMVPEVNQEIEVIPVVSLSQLSNPSNFIRLKQYALQKHDIKHNLCLFLKILEKCQKMAQTNQITTLSPSSILVSTCPNNILNVFEVRFSAQLPDAEQSQELELFQSPETLLTGDNSVETSMIWNIGTILYYLIKRQSYFKQARDVLKFGIELIYQERVEAYMEMGDVSEELVDLIRYSLVRKPEGRVTLGEFQAGIRQQLTQLL